MSSLVYEKKMRIRWNHCDPAGIVYHPQYFVILNNVMEEFFRDCTGLSYEDSLVKKMGFPIVGIKCDFCTPSRCGDECVVKLWIESIGNTSVRFAMTIFAGDECRVACIETAVCAAAAPNGGIEKCEIPADIRARLEAYLKTDDMPKLELRA